MPVHDWTRVDAGIFHHFHQNWVPQIAIALNAGGLPSDYYALVEQVSTGREPDMLTLRGPARQLPEAPDGNGGLMLDDAPPRVQFRSKAKDSYAAKASTVVVRHASGDEVVAILEVVSSGNKSSRIAITQFVEKAVNMLRAGIHVLEVDLYPPTRRDPQGIHQAIWNEFLAEPFELPDGKNLTLASYAAGDLPESFVEPVAVGQRLPDMPLFLSSRVYVSVPLETTYQAAWQALPARWRDVLEGA